MAVLGINCAGRWTNVGVADGGAILAETNRELARRQSELLPSITEETLAAAENRFRAAVVIGGERKERKPLILARVDRETTWYQGEK